LTKLHHYALQLIAAVLVAASAALPTGSPQLNTLGLTQPQPGTVERDVTYCTANGVQLKMDVYFPQLVGGRPAPAVLYVHGGGWVAGSKTEVTTFSREIVAAGYFIASIDYRLAPAHRWPAQIEDTKCALRHLRANAARYGLDPNRIGVWGASAGGHLAALAGLAGKEAGLEGNGGFTDQPSGVQAVVDMFGPTDFTPPLDPAFPIGLLEVLFGKSLDTAGDLLRQSSPTTYVNANAPPFLILHGDRDRVVPLSQSELLHARLQAAGVKSTLVVVKNAGHSFTPSGGVPSPSVPEIGRIILDFLNTNVRDASPASRLFPETGKSVSGLFLQYWQRNGGLAQQGLPISGEMQERSDTDGKTYTVQYFERAVFERHPENAGKDSEVLLSLLGVFRYREKYPQGAPGQVPNTAAGSVLFPETGKRVGGRFLEYWRANGGLAQQGLPISDEFTEVSDLDDKPYRVQYFERAVFEFHPENPAPYDVLLSQLGTFRYKQKYGANGSTR
jgi:acetyl esterase/lipase